MNCLGNWIECLFFISFRGLALYSLLPYLLTYTLRSVRVCKIFMNVNKATNKTTFGWYKSQVSLRCYIVCWLLHNLKYFFLLQEVNVPYVAQTECRDTMESAVRQPITDAMFCAGEKVGILCFNCVCIAFFSIADTWRLFCLSMFFFVGALKYNYDW